MRLVGSLLALFLAGGAFADTLKLRTGRVVNGTYLGGTSRQVRMEVGDRIETFDIGEVASLEFAAAPAPAATAAPAETRPRLKRSENVFRPAPSAAPAPAVRASSAGMELPAGTSLVVRMIDSVDSEKNSVGQTFQASMDEDVVVDGRTLIPRGADVVVKLVDDKESGRLTGRAELALILASVKVDGRVVDVNTQAVTRASGSQTADTAKKAGGGAALGAIIGAIAGGGKGAAIGAAAGAGAGTAVQVVTGGQRVHIPSETRLTFTLDTPVKL